MRCLFAILFVLGLAVAGWCETSHDSVASAYQAELTRAELEHLMEAGWAQAPPTALRHLDRNDTVLEQARSLKSSPVLSDQNLDRWADLARTLALRALFRGATGRVGAADDLVASLAMGQQLRMRRKASEQLAGMAVQRSALRALVTWLNLVEETAPLEDLAARLRAIDYRRAPITISLTNDLSLARKRVSDLCEQPPTSGEGPEGLLIRLRSGQREDVSRHYGRLSIAYLGAVRQALSVPGSNAVKDFFTELKNAQPRSRMLMPSAEQLAKAIALETFPPADKLIESQRETDGFWQAGQFLVKTRLSMLKLGSDWSFSGLQAPGGMSLRDDDGTVVVTTRSGAEFRLTKPTLEKAVHDE
ncbi:MAG: hypothetical protein KC910_12885 [Candidatus Eremiobacteraeota bacterium]|nr:hypothetical protein [Candidatus Eremiobacteraeota bacterium]